MLTCRTIGIAFSLIFLALTPLGALSPRVRTLVLAGLGLRPKTFARPRTGVPHISDFLWSVVGSLDFMRLSFKKGAHAVPSRAAYRKFGVSRSLLRDVGFHRSHAETLQPN